MGKTFSRFLLVGLLLMIIQCLPHASNGIPQTIINSVKVENVKEKIIKDYISDGWSIRSSDSYQITFRKDYDNFLGSVLYGSRFNAVPELRAQFNIIQIDNNVNISCDYRIVTNPNSGFEKYTIIPVEQVTAHLRAIKRYFNGDIGYGLDLANSKAISGILIICVWKGSEAEAAGIIAGDKIKAINNMPVSKIKNDEIKAIFSNGNEGDVLVLTISSRSITKTITIIWRQYSPEHQSAENR